MKFRYYPGDIAAAIAEFIGDTDPATLDGSIYDLKAICENSYNSEYHRDFYRALEKLVDKIEEVKRYEKD